MKAVTAESLTKSYGELQALRGVSFEVDRGEIFGIIGPDGAGKTTLLRILTTLILADGGKASVDGLDVAEDYRAIRNRVGYMPGRFSLYPDLSVEENLSFFASVFRTTIKENYGLIKDIYVQLEPFRHRRAANLSGGMKQKLALCCALIHRPSALFLDEPTTGVDPVSRKEFWAMLGRLSGEGISIVVSTPYMDEASLCGRIALMRGGEFLTVDTPAGIVGSYPLDLLSVRAGDMPALLAGLREWDGAASSFAFGDVHHVALKAGRSAEELGRYLSDKGYGETDIRHIAPSIEDCYMQLTQTDRK